MSTPSDTNLHQITLEKASELVTRFRQHLPSMLHPRYTGALPFSETFHRSVFDTLCSQPGTSAIRIYLGLDENDEVRLVIVGVNEQELDMVSELTASVGSIFEVGQRCPPLCPPGHPLNPTP